MLEPYSENRGTVFSIAFPLDVASNYTFQVLGNVHSRFLLT